MSKPNKNSVLDSALERLTRLGATNLTEQARNGRLRRAYGREKEIAGFFASLINKQSVLLLGPSGVGKTAILHEAVIRVTQGQAPPGLEGKYFFQISTGTIEGGAFNAGQWTQKLEDVVGALRSGKDIYLYIDNFYHIRDAGRYSGMVESFGTHLLPYLERRDIVLIGESTPENYRHSSSHGFDGGLALADDQSLMRHIAVITVEGTDIAATRAIVSPVALDLEQFYKAQILPEAVERSIELTSRFQSGQAFPGKAIHLLEETARELRQTHSDGGGQGEDLSSAKELLVTSDMIMAGFSRLTGLPEKIFSDLVPLRQEEVRSYFSERIIGQQAAVDTIVDLVTLVKAELNDPGRPLGVLLFIGPTGAGKTHMAKTLAEYIFGSVNRLVRFDMSEYQHPDSVPSLGQQFVAKLRRENFSVILLDEIEKATPQAFDLFLQAFDDARMTDSAGRTVDLRNTIIIMTSNLGSQAFTVSPSRPIGFIARDEQVPDPHDLLIRAVEGYFRPEFVNRLDKIVVFRPLRTEDMRLIARRELGKALLREGMTRRDILLDFREDVLDVLASAGFSEKYGARPLQRAIKEMVLLPLARRIAARPGSGHQYLQLHVESGRIAISRIPLSLSAPEDMHERFAGSATDSVAAGGMDLRRLATAIESLQLRLANHVESERFRALEDRSRQLLQEISKPTFWDDQERSRQILSKVHHLERITDKLMGLRSRADALADIPSLIRRHRRPEDVPRLEARYRALENDTALAELEFMATNPDSDATGGAFICISPIVATKARDAGNWPQALCDMYTAWAARKGYEADAINEDDSKDILLVIRGSSVFSILQGDTGIHKRQIEAESSKDRHRAEVQLALVEVLPFLPTSADRQSFGHDEVICSELAEKPSRTGKDRSVKLVEAYHRTENLRVRVQNEDAEQLALALLAARLKNSGSASEYGNDPVRVYSLVRNQYVRDPRTGERVSRVREVLAGAIDQFLLAFLNQLGT